jgi:cytochrome c2
LPPARNDGPAYAFEEAGEDGAVAKAVVVSASTWFSPRHAQTLIALSAALLAAVAVGGCTRSKARQPVDGDPKAGAVAITRHACGSCHKIPGVQASVGMVGPPLGGIAARLYIASHLTNTPDNMILWLRDPQAVFPGNAMPNMGLTDREARDVAAYLYTLR